MKMKFNFLTAFAASTLLFVDIAAADGFATSKDHSSLLVENAFEDLKSRGIEFGEFEWVPRAYKDFKKDAVRLSDANLKTFQHPTNRIKEVTAVLAGNVLILTNDPKEAADAIMDESEASLVVEHVHEDAAINRLKDIFSSDVGLRR